MNSMDTQDSSIMQNQNSLTGFCFRLFGLGPLIILPIHFPKLTILASFTPIHPSTFTPIHPSILVILVPLIGIFFV